MAITAWPLYVIFGLQHSMDFRMNDWIKYPLGSTVIPG